MAAPHKTDQDELLAAVHDLASTVGALQDEIKALRSDGSPLPVIEATHGWDEPAPTPSGGSSAWVRSVETPIWRPPAIPWFLLEVLFLIAVAVFAVLADLDWAAVVGVMAGAWAMVALGELFRARADRRRVEMLYPALARPAAAALDSSWSSTTSEPTMLEPADDAPETQSVTPLPPVQAG